MAKTKQANLALEDDGKGVSRRAAAALRLNVDRLTAILYKLLRRDDSKENLSYLVKEEEMGA